MRKGLILLLAALTPGGCDWFENPTPDDAKVSIEGEAGKQVRLIVSTKFVATVNQDGQTRVVVFEADTTLITLPYEATYHIEEDQRFFAETARLDTDLQTVRMQVFVDSRKRFDEGGPLLEGGRPYRFVYMFNQAITRDVVVI